MKAIQDIRWANEMNNDNDEIDLDELPLFTLSRRDGPETSRQAVSGIKNLNGTRLKILKLFKEFGELDEEKLYQLCSERYGMSSNTSTARARRSDLKRMGLVRDSGRVSINKNGCKTIIWEIVPLGEKK